MTLKKELGIEVTDEELEGMSSLSDILTFANEAA
jgi:acyl carrier protein